MEQGMPNEQTTIAEVLKDAGYYTAHIGKWHLGYANGMDPISQGFQDSLGLLGPATWCNFLFQYLVVTLY